MEWNNGTEIRKFAYIHNLQGDIIALIDDTGAKVVSYTYDAWGKPLSTTGSLANTLGKLNPFRYRGYVYDEETGLYYLRNRYYNQNSCRFISADSIIADRKNLYTYCLNNPIFYFDPFGNAAHDTLQHTKERLDHDLPYEDSLGGGGYRVDFSFAARSSLYHGGLYNCGYSSYYLHPRTDTSTTSNTTVGNTSPSGKTTANSVPAQKQYYHVTSSSNAAQVKATGKLTSRESGPSGPVYALDFQPTQKQAIQLGARSCETVISFKTSAAFERDNTCSIPGALRTVIPGTIQVYDVQEVGFK